MPACAAEVSFRRDSNSINRPIKPYQTLEPDQGSSEKDGTTHDSWCSWPPSLQAAAPRCRVGRWLKQRRLPVNQHPIVQTIARPTQAQVKIALMFGKTSSPVVLAHFMLGNTYSYTDPLWVHQFELATGAGLCVRRILQHSPYSYV